MDAFVLFVDLLGFASLTEEDQVALFRVIGSGRHSRRSCAAPVLNVTRAQDGTCGAAQAPAATRDLTV